jgi:hypothetical protein
MIKHSTGAFPSKSVALICTTGNRSKKSSRIAGIVVSTRLRFPNVHADRCHEQMPIGKPLSQISGLTCVGSRNSSMRVIHHLKNLAHLFGRALEKNAKPRFQSIRMSPAFETFPLFCTDHSSPIGNIDAVLTRE